MPREAKRRPRPDRQASEHLMGRGGQPKDRSDGPERKCIATGEVQPKHGLIRFVVGPDGRLCRICWASCRAGAFGCRRPGRAGKGGEEGLFARAAKQPVTVPEDLATGRAAAGAAGGRPDQLARKAGRRWPVTKRSRTGFEGRGRSSDPGQRRIGTGQIEIEHAA